MMKNSCTQLSTQLLYTTLVYKSFSSFITYKTLYHFSTRLKFSYTVFMVYIYIYIYIYIYVYMSLFSMFRVTLLIFQNSKKNSPKIEIN